MKHGDTLSSHPVGLLRLLGGRMRDRMLKDEKGDEGGNDCRVGHI